MLYLFVQTQFRTQNRFPLLLELLYLPRRNSGPRTGSRFRRNCSGRRKIRFRASNVDPPEAAGNAPKCEKTMEKGAAGAAP
jgi:hypothetical protein